MRERARQYQQRHQQQREAACAHHGLSSVFFTCLPRSSSRNRQRRNSVLPLRRLLSSAGPPRAAAAARLRCPAGSVSRPALARERRRGLRTREDSKRALPAGTAAPRADDGRADGHGGDREQAPAGSPIPQGNAAEKQQRSAAREQITGPGDLSAPQAAELQQTLTLWRDAAARGGPAELDSLRDGNTEFLRWRFREDDLGKHVKKTEDKPW